MLRFKCAANFYVIALLLAALFCCVASDSAGGNPTHFDHSLLADGEVFSVGGNPRDLVLGPDGRFLYVADFERDSLLVVDLVKREEALRGPRVRRKSIERKAILPIHVGNGPVKVVLGPRGAKAYTVNMLSEDMTVVDIENNRILKTVPLGGAPHGVVLGPNGKCIYVTNLFSDEITCIDIESASVIRRAKVGAFPRVVAVSADATQIYVSVRSPNHIAVLSTSDLRTIRTLQVPAAVTDILVLPGDKNAALITREGPTLDLIDLDSGDTTSRIGIPGGTPRAVTMGPGGKHLLASFSGIGRVALIDVAEFTLLETYNAGLAPVSIAVSAEGNRVAVANSAIGRISLYPRAPGGWPIPTVAEVTVSAPKPPVIIAEEAPIIEQSLIAEEPTEAAVVERPKPWTPRVPEEYLFGDDDVPEDSPVRLINADEGDIPSDETELGILKGNVLLSKAPDVLWSDRLEFNRENREVHSPGEVELHRGETMITGAKGSYSLEESTGELLYARTIMPIRKGTDKEAELFLTADKYSLTGRGEGRSEEVNLTTCNFEHPHYRLWCSDVEAKTETGEEGDKSRVIARNMVLYIGGAPLFYWPKTSFFLEGVESFRSQFDIKTGHESELGYFLRTSYNFDPFEGMRASLLLDIYTREALGAGLEGTYAYESGTRGRFVAYGTVKGKGRLEAYHRHQFTDDLAAIAQIEQWSDKNFLKNFYYSEFRKRTEPETFVNLTWTKPHVIASATVRKRTNNHFNEIERLPQLDIDLLDYRLGKSNFFVAGRNAAGYLRSRPDTDDRDNVFRNDTVLRMYYDLDLSIFDLTPFVEYEGTYYSSTVEDEDFWFWGRRATVLDDSDHQEYRAAVNAGVELGTTLRRDYDFSIGGYKGFRHIFSPTLTFSARTTSDLEYDEVDIFDSIDERRGSSRVGIKLENALVPLSILRRERIDEHFPVLSWKLFAGGDLNSEGAERTDWETELMFRFNEKLALGVTGDYHEGRGTDYTRLAAALEYGDEDEDDFHWALGLNFVNLDNQEDSHDISWRCGFPMGEKWHFSFDHRYDLVDHELELQEYTIRRDLHCWEMEMAFRKRQTSTDFMIFFNIKAFPGTRIKF
ncbi:LPS assembly protein LptD [Candidatus Hydrogenedentota bacterium]